MPASPFNPAPDLPIPIFQVSQKVERYLLYDINTITWLRQKHNILGVLIGTLPQIPQQNVFLGLPLELQPEEARILVEDGLGYIVNDLDWHTKGLRSKSTSQIEAIKAELHKDGTKVARELEKSRQNQARLARRRVRSTSGSSSSSDSNIGHNVRTRDDKSEETLFDNSSPQVSIPTTFAPSNSDPKAWTITPATSYPLLATPPRPDSPSLPKVSPCSYALFKHLHSQGYFITPGIRFGCQFTVYPGDPLRFHSHFLAMSANWDEEFGLLDVVGGGRLGTGVKKGWLIGGVEGKHNRQGALEDIASTETTAIRSKNNEAKVRTFCIEWGGM